MILVCRECSCISDHNRSFENQTPNPVTLQCRKISPVAAPSARDPPERTYKVLQQMNSSIGPTLTEILCGGALISVGAWVAGIGTMIFGGTLDKLGVALCVSAVHVGLPIILLAMFVVTMPMAKSTSVGLRRLTFYTGFLASISIIYHGYLGGRVLLP